MKNYLGTFSCLHKGLSNHDAWVARGTIFQEIRPGSDFVQEKFGGLP